MEIVDVVSMSNTASLVTWNPPIEPNGIITGYEVVYSVYGLDAESVVGLLDSGITTVNITNLSKLHMCVNKTDYVATYARIKTHDSESRGQEEAQQRDH